VEAIKQKYANDRFALQQALLPYADLLPARLRGRNERIDEPLPTAVRSAA
jgi:fumarate reductase flavoprotein subunit